MLDIGYEAHEKTVGLWWSDHGHTLPRLEQSAVVAVRDYEELCILSFEYLDAFRRTLEVYFNLTSGITVPKFRLAALHQWFGASFLERKAFFPMVVVQSMAARVWKDLNFEEILCNLLLDRDENVVLGAISLME
uniref:Uncharacterized protein n=1 Tax=Globisporangium ultimum (strain ATCC 200006 / CBS 805.95 / DAOM BR144) TaxID=431595 RepID=K3WCE7_GLOUD